MENIDFKTLVDALKGKGPGDFINDATSGVLKGRALSLDERREAFLQKVKQSEMENQQAGDVYDAQRDLLKTRQDLSGGMQETTVPGPDGKLYRTPAKYSESEAKQLSSSAANIFKMRTGLDPDTFEPVVEVGTKPPPNSGSGLAGLQQTRKAAPALIFTTLSSYISATSGEPGVGVGGAVSKLSGGRTEPGLTTYEEAAGTTARGLYQAVSGDNRGMNEAEGKAAERLLPSVSVSLSGLATGKEAAIKKFALLQALAEIAASQTGAEAQTPEEASSRWQMGLATAQRIAPMYEAQIREAFEKASVGAVGVPSSTRQSEKEARMREFGFIE